MQTTQYSHSREPEDYFGPGVRKFLEENLPIPLKRVRFGEPVRTIPDARRVVQSVVDTLARHAKEK